MMGSRSWRRGSTGQSRAAEEAGLGPVSLDLDMHGEKGIRRSVWVVRGRLAATMSRGDPGAGLRLRSAAGKRAISETLQDLGVSVERGRRLALRRLQRG